jgi:hypothetical protein
MELELKATARRIIENVEDNKHMWSNGFFLNYPYSSIEKYYEDDRMVATAQQIMDLVLKEYNMTEDELREDQSGKLYYYTVIV